MFTVNTYKSGIYSFLLISITSIFLVGCGKDEVAETSSSEDTPQMIERQAPQRQASATPPSDNNSVEDDFRVMPKIDGSLETDGMGLETIIDASNKRAYADSLQWIAEDVSKEQFDRLESSIRYIHMYDSSILGDESRLFSVVDGKTGTEIIEYAKNIREKRRGN